MWCSARVYIRDFIDLLCINDLPNVCKSTNPVLYADETNLFINGKNLIDLQTTIDSELAEISTWLKIIELSVKKTHHMIFTHKRKIQPSVAFSIEGHPIDEAGNTKFLGVYLDNKMNWKKPISYISGKVARGIGLIIKARKMLTCWLYIIILYFHTCLIVITFGAAPTQQI